MLLTPDEIKLQTRQLWRQAFPLDSEEFLDIYFEDRYTDQRNVTVRRDAKVVAATQVLPLQFQFAGAALPAGYISGLATASEHRGKGYGRKVMREALRKMYDEGQVLALLIPGDDQLREMYARPDFGAFQTASHRISVDITPAADFEVDSKLDIEAELEWGDELWQYYNTYAGRHPYEVKHDEDAFFAAIQSHDLADGQVIVARKRGKIVGFTLALKEGKLLKGGRRSTKQFHGVVRFTLTTDERVMHQLHYRAYQLLEVKELQMVGWCPGRGFKGSTPYAMARVVNVERFLRIVGRIFPGLQMSVCVEGDEIIPENNGHYELMDGQLRIVAQSQANPSTPGALAAVFLLSQHVLTPMMLDE
ncbi:MAG: GNAT family N-acetyltransferase [Bacteroidaceae bacterium]|nr:GNAT family N-acetyltransferase [Bacteroidaceae bacterium]